MKHVLLFSLVGISMMPVSNRLLNNEQSPVQENYLAHADISNESNTLGFGPGQAEEKMLAITFRSQEYCRAEVYDFQFETQFKVVSATVYFSGTNFRNAEKGFITSNSLKPIKNLMDRCVPGTIVIFDNVKVIGPDNEVRTIQGTSFYLH
jgi:hypothetical protein